MYTIPVAVFKDATDRNYGAIVPDIPGVYPVGDTIAATIEDSKEAVIAHLECILEAGLPFNLTNIRNIEELKIDPEFSDVICPAIIEIEEKELSNKQIRFNVLARVNDCTRANHDTCSGFPVKAALTKPD